MVAGNAPDCSLAIIGAGVVGCALAAALVERGPVGDGEILLLEAAAREGTGVSARNSGVVHAGLYYEPGSRKARTCVEGNARLWSWVEAHGVAHRRTGKLVVAAGPQEQRGEEETALEALLANGLRCGAVLEPVSLARAPELEPALPATVAAALWSPNSGIVDAHGLVRSLLVAAQDRGVVFVPSSPVSCIEAAARGFVLHTDRGPILAERIVNAAGLHATTLAAQLGLSYRLYSARGDYFRLRRAAPWQRLIYPVKLPGSPSLGIHLTLELDGRARLGPDLEWLPEDRREDYSPESGEAKHGVFLEAARRLLGPLEAEDLVYDGCGIRPKIVGPGERAADFEVVEAPAGAWHLLGIESPGLTAGLALGRELADELA